MKKIYALLFTVHYSVLALCQNVGIGTPTPDHTLDINGTLGINDTIFHNNDLDTWMGFTAPNTWELTVGNKRVCHIDAIGSTLEMNPDQSGLNFLISSDGINTAHFVPGSVQGDALFFADVTNEQIGIGTKHPTQMLDIQGGNILISSDGINTLLFADTDVNRVGIGTDTPDEELHVVGTIKADTVVGNIGRFNNMQYGRKSITGLMGGTSAAVYISYSGFTNPPMIFITIEENDIIDLDEGYSYHVRNVTPTGALVYIQENGRTLMYGDITVNWMAIE